MILSIEIIIIIIIISTKLVNRETICGTFYSNIKYNSLKLIHVLYTRTSIPVMAAAAGSSSFIDGIFPTGQFFMF